MREFLHSPLLKDLAAAMVAPAVPDGEEPAPGIGSPPRFVCRPFSARTSERCTAYGRFKGQIGLSSVDAFRTALDDLAGENTAKIILDFADLSLTRSALGALVAFAAAMQGRNKRLYLLRCSAQIRGELKELGLTAFFSFLESDDDVIATVVV